MKRKDKIQALWPIKDSGKSKKKINKFYYIIIYFKENLKKIVFTIRLYIYLFYNYLNKRNIKFIKLKNNILLIEIYKL